VRFLAFFQYTAVFVGVIAVIAGQVFALPKGVYLGVFLIGAGIALGGFESVWTRRMCFRTSEEQYETYAGTPAMIVGLMALLIGLGIVASAYLLNDGQWYSTVHYLTRRPAPALVAAGLLLIGVGVLMMLNPRGRRGVWRTLLVRIPRGMLGFVVITAGLASICFGVWEWLEPAAFDRFTRSLPQSFDWQAWDRWWRNLVGLRR
jgi:hypothetical protein